MAEFGKIDLDVHKSYAHRQDDFEKWSKDLKMQPSQTRYIAGQTRILDLAPKYPELTRLLQTHQRVCWSAVKAPDNFYAQRSGSYRLAPSLGSSEKLDADIAKIEEVGQSLTQQGLGVQKIQPANNDTFDLEDLNLPPSSQTLSAPQTLVNVVRAVRDMNDLIDYARGRIGQFLQG